MANEVQNTKATISALSELRQQRADLNLRPVTDLLTYFEAGGFFHRCVETGAYSFHA